MELQGNPHKDKGKEEKLNLHLRDVARGGSLAFLGRVLGIALSLGFTILVARLSGAETLGYFSMILTFYMIGVRISSLGLHTSVLKFGGEAYAKGDLVFFKGFLTMALRVTFTISASLGILTVIFSRQVGMFFSKPAFIPHLQLFGFFLPLLSTFYFLTEALKALKKAELVVLFQNIGLYLLASFIYVLLYALRFNSISPTLSFFLSAVLLLGGLFFIFNHIFSKVKARKLKFSRFLKVSLLLMASGIFYFLLIQMDRLMLGYFRPAREVGIYAAASRTALLVGFGLTMINYILPPIISSLFSEGKIREMEALARRTARWALLFSAVVGGFLLVSPELVLKLFGVEFAEGKFSLMILAGAQIISSGLGSVGYILSMTEHQGFYFKITMLSVLLNFAGNTLLVPVLGMVGAAVSTGFSLIFSKVWELFYIKKKMGFWACSLTPAKSFALLVFLLGISLLLLSLNRLAFLLAFPFLSILYLFLNLDRTDKEILLSLF